MYLKCISDRYKHLPRFNSTPRRGLPKTSAEKEVYIFLWYMANTNTFREVSNLFGVSQSTAWHIIQRVTMWLISIGHEYVKWPSRDEIAQNIALMEEKTKMPGILGCIDGSHIKIKAPVLNKENYFNRKHYYSILLQGVVNAKKKFINVFCGEPGSLHDSRLLRRSDLYRVSFERTEERFPFNSFLLGDSAYPCLEWLIPPFKDNGNMTDSQRRFNEIHSSGRIVIEHTFGLLKTRFRRILHFTEHTNINSVVNLVACACILHNMCVDNNDELEESHQHESFPELDSYSGTSSSSRRQQLMEDLINRHII
ncbi:uncharacterized protein LOC129950860 [Eupeodes corollae]|uniref:uncharacterized protein LOC129948458 n=1 Tax=Eupeodes corollae TaxID=290404 RepID=UPI0024929705|nr:uncharacterized protein LOC129948458 [Eupeodes corollae]XP_055918793.1 uncharacterized protein LOC129950860 [Eupeodes corollae]